MSWTPDTINVLVVETGVLAGGKDRIDIHCPNFLSNGRTGVRVLDRGKMFMSSLQLNSTQCASARNIRSNGAGNRTDVRQSARPFPVRAQTASTAREKHPQDVLPESSYDTSGTILVSLPFNVHFSYCMCRRQAPAKAKKRTQK